MAVSVLSPPATLDATLLEVSEELAGIEELAGTEELASMEELEMLELKGDDELVDCELVDCELVDCELGPGAGVPPPPLPPQAVRPATIREHVKVLIRDCMVIPKLRYCYVGLVCGLVGHGERALCKRNLFTCCFYSR